MKKELLLRNAGRDKFNEFGHGVQAYFTLYRNMIYAFCFLCVLALPMIIMYSQGGNYKKQKGNFLKHFLAVASLGNFGESRSICLHQYFNLNFNHTVSCNMGQISTLQYSGIIPELPDDDPDHYEVNDYCYDVKKNNNSKLDECTTKYF